MNVKDLKRSLPIFLEKDICPVLVGYQGEGKTEITQSVVKSLGHHIVMLNLNSQGEVGDILGLPKDSETECGTPITINAMPAWAESVIKFAKENPTKYSVIFLDELNRCHADLRQAIMSLFLEKRIHDLQFPKNVRILAAQNPNTKDFLTKDFDSFAALSDRVCYIKFYPTTEEWLDYASDLDYDSTFLLCVKEHPELLRDPSLEEFKIDFVKTSKRSLSMCHRIYREPIDNLLKTEIITGLVGYKNAAIIMKSLTDQTILLTTEEILNGSKKTKEIIKSYTKENKRASISIINKKLFSFIKENASTLSVEQYNNFLDYLYLIPEDSAYGLCKLITDKPELQHLILKSEKLKKLLSSIKGKKLT